MDAIRNQLAYRLAKCIGGLHFQVAERTLLLWNSERFATLVLEHPNHRAAMLPILFPALYTNQESHWHESIRVLSQRVLEQYAEVDGELVQACRAEFEARIAAEEEAAAAAAAAAASSAAGSAAGTPMSSNPLAGAGPSTPAPGSPLTSPAAGATPARLGGSGGSGFLSPTGVAAGSAGAAGGASGVAHTPGGVHALHSPASTAAVGLHALGVSPGTAAALIHAHKAPAVRSSTGFTSMANADLLPGGGGAVSATPTRRDKSHLPLPMAMPSDMGEGSGAGGGGDD